MLLWSDHVSHADRMVYYGTVSNVIAHFASMGPEYACPSVRDIEDCACTDHDLAVLQSC